MGSRGQNIDPPPTSEDLLRRGAAPAILAADEKEVSGSQLSPRASSWTPASPRGSSLPVADAGDQTSPRSGGAAV